MLWPLTSWVYPPAIIAPLSELNRNEKKHIISWAWKKGGYQETITTAYTGIPGIQSIEIFQKNNTSLIWATGCSLSIW